jgi:hypothetical protein
VKKKDYQYVIVILVVIIIVIFTFYYGTDNNQITSYMGFAGTITSIILAVAALIYTYYQSTTSQTQAQKLADTSDKLINAMAVLDETQKQLAHSVQTFSFVSNQVAEVDNKIAYMMNAFPSPRVPSTVSSYTKEELYRKLSLASINGLLTLLICAYQYQNPKEKSIKSIFNELNEYEDSITYDYCYGFLIGMMTTELVSMTDPNENVRFEFQQYDLFKTTLLEILDSHSEIEPYSAHLKRTLGAIALYYDNYNIY